MCEQQSCVFAASCRAASCRAASCVNLPLPFENGIGIMNDIATALVTIPFGI